MSSVGALLNEEAEIDQKEPSVKKSKPLKCRCKSQLVFLFFVVSLKTKLSAVLLNF